MSAFENMVDIDDELGRKAVVIRDGARGWRLSACFISDALDLLELSDEQAKAYDIPLEDDEDYLEVVTALAEELESIIYAKGYTVAWNDGYVIYKDLSDAAIDALSEV